MNYLVRVLCIGFSVFAFSCGGDSDDQMMNTGGTPVCGNGVVEEGEACDDGNTSLGDYCSSTCVMVTGRCGDGVLHRGLEQCDPGGACGNQFCSDDCQAYTGSCGDGTKQTPEQCDDGNNTAGDGCDPNCFLEAGASCMANGCGPTTC